MKTRLCFLAFGLALGTSGQARAESPAELEELLGQAIVSTPSKGSETDTTAPATSSVITAEELRRFGIRSLDEAINYLSLGMATSSSSHTVEVGARGVLLNGDYGNHVLLLLDGHVMNEPWNGTAYFERGAGVPFEMIDHIEVILGPGSVMYGAQAMLGVVNVVTKRAKDFRGPRVMAEGEAALAPSRGNVAPSFGEGVGGGYRVGAGYGREFTLGNSPSEVTLGLDYYANRGPKWQLGPQPYGDDYVTEAPKNFGPRGTSGMWGGVLRNADYVQVPAAYLRFSTGDFRAALHASAFRRSTAFPDSLAAYTADFDDPNNRELDRFVNLDLSQRFALSSRIELGVRGYGDLYDYHWYNRSSAAEDCPDGFTSGCDRRLFGLGRVLGGELRAQFQWPIMRAFTLVGVDAKLLNVEYRQTVLDRLGVGSVAPVGGQHTDGLIAPYIAQSLSPTSFLDLNVGVRLDDDTRFGERFSPRTAVGVAPWSGGRLKLIYAEAFRGPSAYELNYSDTNAQVTAPSLGPETVRSVEGSFEQRFGMHRLLFGVFRSWWSGLVGAEQIGQDEIDRAVAAGAITPGVETVYRNANIARVDNYGLNAGYDGAAINGRLRFGLNVTIANTHIDNQDGTGSSRLIVAPQTFGNARTSYELGDGLPTVGLAMRVMGRRLADRFYDGGFVPAPSAPPLFTARAAVTGQVAPLPGLAYRLGIDYSLSSVEPYVIGPGAYATDTLTRAELAPTRRAQAFVGFEYAFEHEAPAQF